MSDIDDRWHVTRDGKRVRSPRYGTGKRYAARWRDPARKQRTRLFDRKVDAQRFLAQLAADMNRGLYADPRDGLIPFRDYSELWMAAQEHRPGTVDIYTRHLKNHIHPTFGDVPLAQIRTTAVQGWVKHLGGKGLAPSTIALVYSIFATLMKGAVRDGRIGRTPCDGIRLPDVNPTTIVILTAPQVLALAGAIGARYRPLVLLGAGCGLRQGEAFGVHIEQVRFLEQMLTVDRQVVLVDSHPVIGPPKTKASNRQVPLPEFVALALSEHIRAFGTRTDGALFQTTQGNLLRRDYFAAKTWARAVKKAGLPEHLTFHDLRHTFASTMLAASVPISDVSKWLGHASIQETVDTYGHLVVEAPAKARHALDDAFSAPGCAPDVRQGRGAP